MRMEAASFLGLTFAPASGHPTEAPQEGSAVRSPFQPLRASLEAPASCLGTQGSDTLSQGSHSLLLFLRIIYLYI